MGCLSKIWIVFKQYLANCNLHGIRYIVEDGFHWTERLFWFITCALCWYGCATMILSSLDSFQNQAVAITVETTYIDWQTNFPSISLCVRPHPNALLNAKTIYKKKFGTDIPPTSWKWLFSGTFRKERSKTIADALLHLTAEDIAHLYEQSMLKCSEFMSECSWRSVKFNCCEEFLPLKTATGLCYVFNSRHTKPNPSSNKFVMNRDTGISYLSIGLTSLVVTQNLIQIVALIHSNLAIPVTMSKDEKSIDLAENQVNTVYFNLQNIHNEEGLIQVSPKKRKCRFPEETDNFYAYKQYSYSGCFIQLLMENMIKVCGCVSNLFPYGPLYPVCNYTSLLCLHDNDLLEVKKDTSEDRCLPDCEDIVMRHFQNIEAKYNDFSQFNVSQGIRLAPLALPSARYKRYVVRSLLDLVGETMSIHYHEDLKCY